MKLENIIYSGDNLIWLKKFPDKYIDLIYLDPPFFSNKHYEVIFNDGEEIRSFEDRWQGGINHYIEWMKERVFELHRVLKDTGSFYLHCDWHASHYLKVMCDDIFGVNNFLNELVWAYRERETSKRFYNRKHDVILFYVKNNKSNYIFNYDLIREKYSEVSIQKFKYTDENEKNYRLRYKDGRSDPIQESEDTYRQYLNDESGPLPRDWFVLPFINQASLERFGYPTQKPEALLERIVKASSNKEDLILDPFCGCGTTIAVAQRLNRKWIGIDVSPAACKLMKNRVEKNGARGIEIIGLPVNMEDLKKLPPFEFQNWCIGALGGTVNSKKVGDMGIDGFTFFNRYPIQVKQSENVGRNVVDNFETALQRNKKDKGFIIALSFGKGAYEEAARIKKEGLFIDLLVVDKLLGFSEERVSDLKFEFF
ncbi:MAG: DNA methyltransferase [Candidatus Humimicrobiaceae bacterium]